MGEMGAALSRKLDTRYSKQAETALGRCHDVLEVEAGIPLPTGVEGGISTDGSGVVGK
jgi:hypothetical protein